MRWLPAAMLMVAASPAAARPIAIVHARAWTMTAALPIEDATIMLEAGRIVSVTARAVPPADARVLDAKGRVVTPGLMNAATQLGLVEVSGATETNDQRARAGPLGAAFDVQYALNPAAQAVALARADGLTRAADLPDAGAGAPFAGRAAVLRLGDDELLDRARAAVVAVVGGGAAAATSGSRAVQWGLIRNALKEASAFAARRPHTGLRDQLLDRPDAEALADVVAGRTPLAIHADRASDIRQAIRLAADEKVRVILIGGAEAWSVADALAAARIPVILDPMQDLPTSFDALGSRLDNAALLARARVEIAFSVSGNGIHLSNNAGLSLRQGAGIAVANGLSYASALRAVTVVAAHIWGIADHYGTIAPGQEADIVVWDGDPLEPSSAPVLVFVRGQEASLVTRQTMLRDRYFRRTQR